MKQGFYSWGNWQIKMMFDFNTKKWFGITAYCFSKDGGEIIAILKHKTVL